MRLAQLLVATAAAGTLATHALGQLSVQVAFQVPTVPQPYGAASADFTGDGYADVLVTSVDTDELRLMVGNGFGVLAMGPVVATGSQTNPGDMRAFDADGDGDLDVVVCLRNVGAVAIYENDGTGFLNPLGSYPVGDDSIGPDVGDLDHDGDIDIVVANRSDETVSVLTNQNGSFTVQTFPTGPDPRGAAFVDIDNDGDMDVAATSNDDRTVHLFRNDGGVYSALAILSGPPSVRPTTIRSADLNSDGWMDLAVASAGGSSSLTIFINNSGTFAAPVNYASGGSTASAISIDDLECDGDLDIALVNSGSETVSLFANNGNGTFANPMLIPTGTTPSAITSTDIDSDGDTDLALTNTAADSVTVVLLGCGHGGGGGNPVCGNGVCEPGESLSCIDCQGGGGGGTGPAGHFAFDQSIFAATDPFGSAVVDYDNDGDGDILLAVDFPELLRVYANDGNGQFTLAASYPLPYYSIPQEIVTGDLDNDGITDAAVTLSGTSGIVIFRGTGSGFVNAKTIPTGLYPIGLAIGDADGDGRLDLAAASSYSGTVTFAKNQGLSRGVWQFATQVVSAGGDPTGCAFVDIAGDGSAELAASSDVNHTISLYSFVSGALASVDQIDVGTVVSTAQLRAGDMNGDGFTDLIAAAHSFGDPENGCITWLSNGATLGAGTFHPGDGMIPLYLSVTDLDCDGDLDVALVNSDSDDVTVLANSGTGLLGPGTAFPLGSVPMAISAGDVSGDGVADLVVANVNSNTVSVLTNLSCVPTGATADLDGDGTVGGADLAILLGAWGTAGADIDGDGTTGGSDLAMLLGAWS